MRRTMLALVLLSLPVGVLAGTHRAGAGGGGGRAGGSTLWGAMISGELVIKHYGHSFPAALTLSAVADLAWMGGERKGNDSFDQKTFVVGGRLTYNSLKWIQPFGHGMVGGYWAEGHDSGATVLGGGFDFPLGKVTSEGHPHWVIRIQGDRYWADAQDRSYPQFTGQLVYRFE